MSLLTIEIKNQQALKKLRLLEQNGFIKIIDGIEKNSCALPGKQISLKDFKAWIKNAETSPTIFLKEIKQKWVAKRKQLQQHVNLNSK